MTNTLGATQKAEAGHLLTRAEAEAVMEELLSGLIETPEIVRLLVALNQRAPTAGLLAGFASVMRRHAAPVFAPGIVRPENLVDTCGTGGDSSGTFNISTAAAIVASAAGAHVAKHGNRSVSSRSGSADVIEALGVRIDLPMERVGRSISETGIGFLFAPAAHAATRHAAAARKQIGKRTVFNLLGPLTNPASAEMQVLGVFSPHVLELVATTLGELGIKRAFVVHGSGGLDEIALAGETRIAEVRGGSVRLFSLAPEEFGVRRAPLEAIRGGSPQENAALIRAILDGQPGAMRDVVIVNAAAALVVTDLADDFREAAALAARAIDAGAAREKLERLVAFTNEERPKHTAHSE